MYGALRLGLAAAILSVFAGCSFSARPHVLIEIEDPGELAMLATQIAYGADLSSLVRVDMNGADLPTSVTLSGDTDITANIWVEAQDATGNTLGRTRIRIRLNGQTVVAQLQAPCETGTHEGRDCSLEQPGSPGVCFSRQCAPAGGVNCPAFCDDGNICTNDSEVDGVGLCEFQCEFIQVAECINDDTCCPSGCTSQNDNDCAGGCPTFCNDGNACTTGSLITSTTGACEFECAFDAVLACVDDDGCCPEGCFGSDSDCLAIVPETLTLPAQTSFTFQASGGTPPYVFTVAASAGSIDPLSGLYTAPEAPGSYVVTVNDVAGDFAQAQVTVELSGTLDSAYGNNGTTRVDFGYGDETAKGLALQTDGKAVVVGRQNGRFLATRIGVDGRVDADYSSFGLFDVDINNENNTEGGGQGVAMDSQGNAVLGGWHKAGTDDFRAAALRLGPNGILDSGFADAGIGLVAEQKRWNAVARQQNDAVVLVGTDHDGTAVKVLRLTPQGVLDPSFGTDGLVTADLAIFSNERPNAVLVDGQDRILVTSAKFTNGFNLDFAVLRFTPDGQPDGTFAIGGRAFFRTSDDDEHPFALAIGPGDEIVMAGLTENGALTDVTVARLLDDGTLDDAFGTGGIVVSEISPGNSSSAAGVAVQPDGRIVVAGQYDNNGDVDALLLRYNTDGTLDTSFGPNDDGIVTIDQGATETFTAVTLDTQGGIIAVGESGGDFLIQRYRQ